MQMISRSSGDRDFASRGFKQKITEDYFETFPPVLWKESLKLFVALMCWFDSQCDQTDVDSAFPYADTE